MGGMPGLGTMITHPDAPAAIGIRAVMDDRLRAGHEAYARLRGTRPSTLDATNVDELHRIAARAGYQVCVTRPPLADPTEPGVLLDAVFWTGDGWDPPVDGTGLPEVPDELTHNVPYAGDEAAAAKALQDRLVRYLRTRLPRYEVPSAIVEVPGLPHTASGKVDRARLRHSPAHLLPGGGAGAAAVVPAGSEREIRLRDVFARLFGVDPAELSVEQSFFALGGNSLLAVDLVARCREAGLPLGIRDVFVHQSVRQLAAAIDEEQS
jgi:hypothetical protein